MKIISPELETKRFWNKFLNKGILVKFCENNKSLK